MSENFITPQQTQPPGAALTPLTLLLIGTLAGYYWTYAVGLLRWLGRSRGLSRGAQSPS